jgi:hypothetical protein
MGRRLWQSAPDRILCRTRWSSCRISRQADKRSAEARSRPLWGSHGGRPSSVSSTSVRRPRRQSQFPVCPTQSFDRYPLSFLFVLPEDLTGTRIDARVAPLRSEQAGVRGARSARTRRFDERRVPLERKAWRVLGVRRARLCRAWLSLRQGSRIVGVRSIERRGNLQPSPARATRRTFRARLCVFCRWLCIWDAGTLPCLPSR